MPPAKGGGRRAVHCPRTRTAEATHLQGRRPCSTPRALEASFALPRNTHCHSSLLGIEVPEIGHFYFIQMAHSQPLPWQPRSGLLLYVTHQTDRNACPSSPVIICIYVRFTKIHSLGISIIGSTSAGPIPSICVISINSVIAPAIPITIPCSWEEYGSGGLNSAPFGCRIGVYCICGILCVDS